jgi:hypothetical protein
LGRDLHQGVHRTRAVGFTGEGCGCAAWNNNLTDSLQIDTTVQVAEFKNICELNITTLRLTTLTSWGCYCRDYQQKGCCVPMNLPRSNSESQCIHCSIDYPTNLSCNQMHLKRGSHKFVCRCQEQAAAQSEAAEEAPPRQRKQQGSQQGQGKVYQHCQQSTPEYAPIATTIAIAHISEDQSNNKLVVRKCDAKSLCVTIATTQGKLTTSSPSREVSWLGQTGGSGRRPQSHCAQRYADPISSLATGVVLSWIDSFAFTLCGKIVLSQCTRRKGTAISDPAPDDLRRVMLETATKTRFECEQCRNLNTRSAFPVESSSWV